MADGFSWAHCLSFKFNNCSFIHLLFALLLPCRSCCRHIRFLYDSYLNTYTYHYITDEWCLESRVLKTSLFEGKHTGQNIADDFNRAMIEYKLEDKEVICVTDSAANMVCGCRIIGNKRIPCIAHKTNSMIQKDFLAHDSSKPFRDVLKKVREAQSKLLYRHEELMSIRNDDIQKQLCLFLNEIAELEQAVDAEEQFADTDYNPTRSIGNDFTGLKSISEIRWNCIYTISKCYLDNASEFNELVLCLKSHFIYKSVVNNNWKKKFEIC